MKTTTKPMADWSESDMKKARRMVRTVLAHVGKISRYRWRVFSDDLIDNALARSWRDIYRLGEELDLDAPSEGHLRIIAENCKLVRSDSQHFPESVYSVREIGAILAIAKSTVHGWMRSSTHEVNEMTRAMVIHAGQIRHK